jgi:4-carboxymuconolactone decarboxylase
MMSRLPPIDQNALTVEQRRMFDETLRVRGQVRGPFAIWLNSPVLGDLALRTQDWFQKQTQLPARLLELAILVMARKATAQFAWAIHEKRGLECGLSEDVVAAIKLRTTPRFEKEDERLVYDIACELFETQNLSSKSYERGQTFLGVQALVELVSLVGFYVMVAMVLNTFDADPPQGKRPLD